MNKTFKQQLIEWQKKHEKQEKRKKKSNGKCKCKKETLSQHDLLELMGVNRPTFVRKKGGAYRQRGGY